MKQVLLLSFFILSISKIHSQPYFFSHTKELYTNLTDATSINNGNVWGGFQTFNIPIGFSFNYMDSSFSSVGLEATGRLIFDDSHYYYADMFVVSGMRDKGTVNSLSPLSYQLMGVSGNQILKIEVKNATYQNDLNSTVNYQIWLYENSGRIELHMGPNNVTNSDLTFPSGAFSGVFNVISFSPMSFAYGLALSGSPLMPSDSTFTGTGVNTFGITLNSIPTDSTVYIFSTEITSTSINNFEKQDRLNVFPNPVINHVSIKFQNVSTSQRFIEVYSLLGEKVKTVATTADEIEINTTAFVKGVYFIVVNDEGLRTVKKIVKV